jgi:hypothetical protein
MKKIITAFAFIIGFSFMYAPTLGALGISDVKDDTAKGACEVKGREGCNKNSTEGNLRGLFSTIVNILLFIVGAVAVIMLVIGGLKYVTSNGDQSAITSAKQTILYAIIGIVVAFLAYAMVNFVVTQLSVNA